MTKGSGTFIGAKLTEQSAKQLVKWMDRVGISDPVPLNELHCTITFDADREFEHNPMEFSPPIDIDPATYELKLFGPNKDILVLGFECPELANRFNTLIKRYDITPTYPRYKPHVTLSYTPQKNIPESAPEFGIQFGKEYTKPFDPPPGTVKESLEILPAGSFKYQRDDVPVLLNPSKQELIGFVKRHRVVRGVLVGENLLFAPAKITMHEIIGLDIAPKLGIEGQYDSGGDMTLGAEGTMQYGPNMGLPEVHQMDGIEYRYESSKPASRHLPIFNRLFSESMEVVHARRGEVPILVNPSWLQLFGFVKRHHQVRGVLMGDSFYFAPADLVYHNELATYGVLKLGATNSHDMDVYVYLPAVRDEIPEDWQASPTRTVRGLAVAVMLDADYNDVWADPRMQKFFRPEPNKLVAEGKIEIVHYYKQNIPIMIDPSPKQLLGFANRYEQLRGVRINGHMLFAPANSMIHAILADRIAAELGFIDTLDKAWKDKWEEGYNMYVYSSRSDTYKNNVYDFEFGGMKFEILSGPASDRADKFINGIFYQTGKRLSEGTDPESFEIINDLPVKKIKSKTTKVTKRFTDLIQDNLKKLGLA